MSDPTYVYVISASDEPAPLAVHADPIDAINEVRQDYDQELQPRIVSDKELSEGIVWTASFGGHVFLEVRRYAVRR